ncbi:hypothetical protein KP014_20890 [Paenibacillus sophorae]|nr:hypothetical protein [Paenibacillus sophorae]QWU14366.1 hypothetical protein KP014_20890 [Paenibacillus sophorae]
MAVTDEIDNEKYNIDQGMELSVQSQSIDKKKWFVLVPSLDKFDFIEKYYFDFLIDGYITYPKYCGEFQLPVISENIHTYTCILPS